MIRDLSGLSVLIGTNPDLRIAIMGIGNDTNGDDAAGVLVARGLLVKKYPRCLVIDAGPAPENFTGTLRRFEPNLVVMIDAAEMGEEAGSVRAFEWTEIDGMSASTHTLSPVLLAKYLIGETGCQVVLIGIQPATIDYGSTVSTPVKEAVRWVILELENIIAH